MSNFWLMNLTPSIITRLTPREGDEDACYFFSELLRHNKEDYIAYAACEKSHIIGIGAVCRIMPGVAEALMTFPKGYMESEYSPSTRFVYKQCCNTLEQARDKLNLKRVQAYIDPSYPEHMNFIKHLGFEREGLLRKFWNDKDYFIYARIF